MQRFELSSKEDFIKYLWFLTRACFLAIDTHRSYLDQLKAAIKERGLETQPNSRVPVRVYREFTDKIGSISCHLMNLMGDHSDKAASYKKFRYEANKKNAELDLKLPPLNEEVSRMLNEMNVNRNWSLHVPESLITSEFEVRKSILKKTGLAMYFNPIYISNHLYYDGRYLTSLRDENQTGRQYFTTIFQQMKKDYSILLGQPIKIEWDEKEIRPFEDILSIEMSSQVQRKKYEGVDVKKLSELTKRIVAGVKRKRN